MHKRYHDYFASLSVSFGLSASVGSSCPLSGDPNIGYGSKTAATPSRVRAPAVDTGARIVSLRCFANRYLVPVGAEAGIRSPRINSWLMY